MTAIPAVITIGIGRDIQAPGTEPAGLSCRVYRQRDGRLAGFPDPADVREALRGAGGGPE